MFCVLVPVSKLSSFYLLLSSLISVSFSLLVSFLTLLYKPVDPAHPHSFLPRFTYTLSFFCFAMKVASLLAAVAALAVVDAAPAPNAPGLIKTGSSIQRRAGHEQHVGARDHGNAIKFPRNAAKKRGSGKCKPRPATAASTPVSTPVSTPQGDNSATPAAADSTVPSSAAETPSAGGGETGASGTPVTTPTADSAAPVDSTSPAESATPTSSSAPVATGPVSSSGDIPNGIKAGISGGNGFDSFSPYIGWCVP